MKVNSTHFLGLEKGGRNMLDFNWVSKFKGKRITFIDLLYWSFKQKQDIG